jgi:uncharacterized membrane protein
MVGFTEWVAQNSSLINLTTSLILSVATTIYVVFTIKLVNETRKSRLQQLEPHLIIYFDNNEASAHNLYLKVINLGSGVAYNVIFDIIKDIKYSDSISLSEINLFKKGIKYFPENKEFKYLITSTDSNSEEKKNDFIKLKVSYNDALGNSKSEIFNFNLFDCYGDGILTPPDTYVGLISHRLGKVEKLLGKLLKK